MEEKKNNSIKILIIVLCCIGVLLLVCGLLFNFSRKDEDKEKGKDEPVDKRKVEEKLAKSILTTLNIDDYLGVVFNQKIEVNKNILDVNSNKDMIMYFIANENILKYKLNYGNNIDSIIVKYDDYLAEHEKIFAIKSNIGMSYADFIFADPNLSGIINSDYQVSINNIAKCDFNNSSNCFIILANETVMSNRVEFSDLSIKDNVIESNLKLYSGEGESEVYLDGKFKFEFEKNGDNYIAKSLIITYVADAYNGVVVVE